MNLVNNQVIDMKFGLNGGQDFYWIRTKNKDNELDRRGGILLKTAGVS